MDIPKEKREDMKKMGNFSPGKDNTHNQVHNMKKTANLKEKIKGKQIANYLGKIRNGHISPQYQTSNNIKEHSYASVV